MRAAIRLVWGLDVKHLIAHRTRLALSAFGIAVGVVGMLCLAFLGYRIYRLSERAEALTAATYLEAKRALEQHR